MKARNTITTIARIATRAIIGGAIGYVVGYAIGTAIDRIRTKVALKKSIEDAANDPRVRRVHIDRINIDRVPVERTPIETIDLKTVLEGPCDALPVEEEWAVVDNTHNHKVYRVGDYDTCCEYADMLNFEHEKYAPDSDIEFGVELAEGLLYDSYYDIDDIE